MMLPDVVTRVLAPCLGATLSNVTYLSSLPAILRMRKAGDLGAINPIPFPVIVANCFAWLAYAFNNKDWYVLASNLPGLLLGLFFTLSCYKVASPRQRSLIEAITLAGTFAVTLTSWAAVTAFPDSHDSRAHIIGVTAVAILVVFYVAPLSSLATVIKTRDASSINVPLATANLVSGSVWIVYGLALRDVYLWGPCTIGAPLGLLQILIKAFLRKRDPALPLHRRLPTEDYHSAHTPEVALVHEDFHHDATLPKYGRTDSAATSTTEEVEKKALVTIMSDTALVHV